MPCNVSSEVPVAFDEFAQLLVGGPLPYVDPLEIGDELGGDATAGLAGGVPRSHLGQQRLGLRDRQIFFAPPKISSSSR